MKRLGWDTLLYSVAVLLLLVGTFLFFRLRRTTQEQIDNLGGPTRTIVVSPDKKLIAVAHRWGQVNIWDRPTGRRLYGLPYSGRPLSMPDSTSAMIAFSPEGLLAVAEQSNAISLWDVSSKPAKPVRKLLGKLLPSDRIRFAAASQFAISYSHDVVSDDAEHHDSEIVVWNYRSGAVVFKTMMKTLRSNAPDGFRSVAISPDGQELVALTLREELRTWKLPSDHLATHTSCLSNLPSRPSVGRYKDISFRSDGRALLGYRYERVAGNDKWWLDEISPLDCLAVRELFSISQKTFAEVSADQAHMWPLLLQIASDGNVLATSSGYGVRLYDRRRNTEFAVSSQSDVFAVAPSEDGSMLATSSAGSLIKISDTVSGRTLNEFGVIDRSSTTLWVLVLSAVLSAGWGLVSSFRQYHRFRQRSTYRPGGFHIPAQDDTVNSAIREEVVSDVIVPMHWAEPEITRQLLQLRESRPALIPHYIDSIKERFIIRQDDRTALLRLEFLKTQIEQLRAAKDFQQAINDLTMLVLERAKRQKTLELENAELDLKRRQITQTEEMILVRDKKKLELEIAELSQRIKKVRAQKGDAESDPEQKKSKERDACEARLAKLRQEEEKAAGISDERERTLKLNAIADAIAREMERWGKTLL